MISDMTIIGSEGINVAVGVFSTEEVERWSSGRFAPLAPMWSKNVRRGVAPDVRKNGQDERSTDATFQAFTVQGRTQLQLNAV